LEEHDPDLVQAAQVPELVERYRERPVPMGIRQSVRREGVVFGFVEGRAEADYVAETSQLSLLDLVQGEFSRQMDGHDLSDLEARADAYIGLRSQFGHEVVTAASASVELWPAGSEGSRLIGALYRLRVEKLVGKGTDAGAAAVEVRQGLVRGFGAATIDAANLEAAEALVAV